MNKEVIKAINNKEKKHTISKWWNKNGYKVMRVVFFPIWGCVWAKGKIENSLNAKCEWSEERANEILSYYIPRMAKWNKDEKCFYFVDNGLGWGMSSAKKLIKLRDRRWWNLNRGFYGGKIRTYLIEQFEMEGFRKEIGQTYDEWIEVYFYLIEK